ncbi:hypothetical protein [Frankia sp. Cj5]|uniref:hypothetical protein n=1 Tax=Frankia sp. Cj5 TaxID=2880978 RepID=UPI001EF433E0|nr:hypothetical protein [Frankia sp. Cj5]
MNLNVVALVFRCRIVGGTASTSDETSRLRWISPDEIRASMDEAYAVRLLDATCTGPPAVRAHDGRALLPA